MEQGFFHPRSQDSLLPALRSSVGRVGENPGKEVGFFQRFSGVDHLVGRSEVVGTRKNGHARRRHARGEGVSPLACLSRTRPRGFLYSPEKNLKNGCSTG